MTGKPQVRLPEWLLEAGIGITWKLQLPLVKAPPILLCDEPTGDLDFETGKHILSVMRDINRKNEKTVIIVTHNTAIGEMADKVLRLRSGQVVEMKDNPSPIDPDELRW